MAFNGLNAPPPDAHIFLNEGEQKYVAHTSLCMNRSHGSLWCRLTYKMDTKIPDAGTFIVLKEDHSLGNILRT
jgi:hypothetical protein